MIKLFHAWSIADNFSGRDRVTIEWFRVGREQPVAPYQQLIGGYDVLLSYYQTKYPGVDPEYARLLRQNHEQSLNELFTEAEVDDLARCLSHQFGYDIQIEDVQLPLSAEEPDCPFGLIPAGTGHGRYQLWMQQGYNLPFKVAGYFDIRGCAPSVELDPTARERGAEFIRLVLANLGVSSDLDRVCLETAAKAAYDQLGLYCERGKTREERIREKEETLAIRKRAVGDGWVAWDPDNIQTAA